MKVLPVCSETDKQQTGYTLEDVNAEHSIWKSVSGHVNVLDVDSVFISDTDPQKTFAYLLMERCDTCLRSKLNAIAGREDLAVNLVHGMLAGLSHLHGMKVVHRDIKLSNCLVSDDCQDLKICDFGVAAVLPTCGYLEGVVGTAPYMAPEIVLAQRYGYPVDVWAAGVCYHQLIFGRFPFPPPRSDSKAKAFEAVKRSIAQGTELTLQMKGFSAPTLDIAQALLRRKADLRPSCLSALRMCRHTMDHHAAKATHGCIDCSSFRTLSTDAGTQISETSTVSPVKTSL